ncbi:hypothetical protein JW868_03220 [Candidatus Woesearchaeota archaeon]|nr:hypothetical protein [Candidatus Woesearchaeota archaeon]
MAEVTISINTRVIERIIFLVVIIALAIWAFHDDVNLDWFKGSDTVTGNVIRSDSNAGTAVQTAQETCELNNKYWYGNQCHSQPETSETSGDIQNSASDSDSNAGSSTSSSSSTSSGTSSTTSSSSSSSSSDESEEQDQNTAPTCRKDNDCDEDEICLDDHCYAIDEITTADITGIDYRIDEDDDDKAYITEFKLSITNHIDAQLRLNAKIYIYDTENPGLYESDIAQDEIVLPTISGLQSWSDFIEEGDELYDFKSLGLRDFDVEKTFKVVLIERDKKIVLGEDTKSFEID